MLSLFTEMQLYVVNFLFVLMLLTSIMIALQNNPVYAVFSFILTALMVCVCFLLLGAEFFALLILVVYTGVITVLFLFVVIMYNLREMLVSLRGIFYHPFFFFVLYKLYWSSQVLAGGVGNLFSRREFALEPSLYVLDIMRFTAIFNEHCFLFLFCGLLIFIAMIGSIVLTFPFYKY